jgi:hypothetical protein
MAGKLRRWRMALVLLLGLLTVETASAGPYLGDWGWFWHPAHDCPRGDYSFLHYWAPAIYRVRACIRRPNLDQYPPGPYPTVPESFESYRSPCMTTPPAPTAPYADPARYFGLPPVAPKD